MILAGFVKELNAEEDTPYRPCILINERLLYGWRDGLIKTEVLDSGIKLVWKHTVLTDDNIAGFCYAKEWIEEKLEELVETKKVRKIGDNEFEFIILDEEIQPEKFLLSSETV